MGKVSPDQNIELIMKQSGKSTVVLGDAFSYTSSTSTETKNTSKMEYKPFDQSCHNSKTYKSTLFKDTSFNVEPVATVKPAKKFVQTNNVTNSRYNVFSNANKGVEANPSIGNIKVAERNLKRPTTSETCNLKSCSDLIQAEDRKISPTKPSKNFSPDKATMKLVINAVKPEAPKKVGIPPGGHSTLAFNWE